MPKKLATNPKSQVARERKETAKKEKRNADAKAADDALWADEGSSRQEKLAKEKEAKTAAAAAKKAAKAALLAADKAEVSKHVAGPKKPAPKPTRAVIMSIQERKAQEAKKADEEEAKRRNRILDQPDLTPNVNLERRADAEADIAKYGKDNVVEAQSIEAGISALKIAGGKDEPIDRHVEKRLKAAFLAFEEREMKMQRAENPTLKFSQLKQRIWDMWLESEENPRVAAAANDAQRAIDASNAVKAPRGGDDDED